MSLVLIAGGAILAFAVTGSPSGVDIHTVGWILIAVGFFGLLLSLIMWETWTGAGYWSRGAPPPPGEAPTRVDPGPRRPPRR